MFSLGVLGPSVALDMGTLLVSGVRALVEVRRSSGARFVRPPLLRGQTPSCCGMAA